MTYPLTTTLNRINACHPCHFGWEQGLAAAGKSSPDDEPILFAAIAETLGIKNAIWCMRAEPQYSREWRLFAVWCARQVQHLMTDQRSVDALEVAERHANGQATDADLAAARAAASKAASWAPSNAASWAAFWAAAWAAACAASWDASNAAATASDVAFWAAFWAASSVASSTASSDAQCEAFIQLCNTGTLP